MELLRLENIFECFGIQKKIIGILNVSLRCTDTGERECQCLRNLWRETSDVGIVSNWPLFPLVSWHLGDTGHDWEFLNFRGGPLVCKQGKNYDNMAYVPKYVHWDTIVHHRAGHMATNMIMCIFSSHFLSRYAYALSVGLRISGIWIKLQSVW